MAKRIEREKSKTIIVAITMLFKGFDIETIAEITKLQLAEIEALQKG